MQPLVRSRLGALALFAALAVMHTWPLASNPARLSRNDNADTVLNEWIVAWIAHQAPRDPRQLWDANIFYPERHTLAYSEPLIVPAAMGAPFLWAGCSPVLVYNLLVLAGLTLTGWAGWVLVHRWTGDFAAAVLAGCLIAFNAHTLTRLPHLQALHVEFLPLALLAFDSLLSAASSARRTIAAAAGLAACVVLQGATSYYALIFTITALACGALVRPREWLRPARWRTLIAIAGAAVVSAAALAPLLFVYREVGHVRPLDEVARYSASWSIYLASPARIHYRSWSAAWFNGDTALFPGTIAVLLACIPLATGIAFSNARARTALAFGLAGLALSFGPALPGYAALYELFAPLQGIRNAARFGYLAIVGLAILAGFGLAAVRSRWRERRWLPLVSASVIAFANLDALAAPIGYSPPSSIAAIETSLQNTNAIVVHVPFYPPDRLFRNAPYLLETTANWRPMLNGYSGFVPDSYTEHARLLANFPDSRSIAALRSAGVTHVFVHDRALRDWTDNETADAVRRSPDLFQVAREGDLWLYTLK